jgi:hypothetical protein
MQDEVLEFIQRRWQQDFHWLDGNCYWFARILCERFPYLKIYYMPIIGHFVAGTPSRYYDWTGLNKDKEKPILLDEIQKTDNLWYEHLMRDCRD